MSTTEDDTGRTLRVSLRINGRKYSATVEARQLLVEFIRREAGLTGTHVGCDTSYCGACTVIVDGRSVKSCTVLTAQADEREIETVEGLEREGHLHPLQEAFARHHALQCGFCTPGFLMSAKHLLAQKPSCDREAIRKGLAGNICRCTGYLNIIDAVAELSGVMPMEPHP
jgi:carbon-monoxide dehydrogenase small subunit